jgi:uncharacterized protein
VAFGAAVLNGMIGYGFSSTVTPVALLWVSNRWLNPALVLVEFGVNATLLVKERREIRATWPRARSMLPGLLPGAILGTVALAVLAPANVKLIVYGLLLPLIGLQLLGFRRPIARERAAGPFVGSGIGFLYSLTTISGPPLALFWRNQGLSRSEFRCAMAQVRLAESSLTLGIYFLFGMFTAEAWQLVPYLLLPVLAGVPIGALLLRGLTRASFGTMVMAADALLVGYGLTTVLSRGGYLASGTASALLLLLVAIVLGLTLRALHRLPVLRSSRSGEPATGEAAALAPVPGAPP